MKCEPGTSQQLKHDKLETNPTAGQTKPDLIIQQERNTLPPYAAALLCVRLAGPTITVSIGILTATYLAILDQRIHWALKFSRSYW